MNLVKAMQSLHACKIFDTTKEISSSDWREVLEAGRLTPSSFGLEPTRLLVIETQDLKDQIAAYCWYQKQIPTCRKLVILKSKVQDLIAPSDYIAASMRKRGFDERFMERLAEFQKKSFPTRRALEDWSMEQAYLMASSMVNCAGLLGIDSCYLEGFEREKLEEFLGLDSEQERIALLLTFGYRLNEPKEKIRISLDELVETR